MKKSTAMFFIALIIGLLPSHLLLARSFDIDLMVADIDQAQEILSKTQIKNEFTADAALNIEISPTSDPQVDMIHVSDRLTYQVGPANLSEREQNEYEDLSSEEKERFHTERRVRLLKLAQVLSVAKPTRGLFVAIKNIIIRPKIKADSDLLKLSTLEKSVILNYYNSRLWKKARKLGKKFNIRGISAMLGLKFFAGLPKFAYGHARFLSIDIGYNSETQSITVKIDQQTEKMGAGLAAEATLASKLYFYTSNGSTQSEFGESYYPPSLPIPLVAGGFGSETSSQRTSAGLYFAVGPDMFPFGYSRGDYKKVTVYAKEFFPTQAYKKWMNAMSVELTDYFELSAASAQSLDAISTTPTCYDYLR